MYTDSGGWKPWVAASLMLGLFFGGLMWVGASNARLGTAGPRTVTVQQVGKGYTITCKEERGVYDYYAGVAVSVDEVKDQVGKCLTSKITTEWGQ